MFAGSVNVQQQIGNVDSTPPIRITDLRADLSIKYRNSVILSWTAPGDDLDVGTGIYMRDLKEKNVSYY